jgi:hypothetical protein
LGDSRAELEANERRIGGHMPLARVFRSWGQPLNSGDIRWMISTHHTLMLSVQSQRGGRAVPWRAVASAAPGSPLYRDMQTMAQQIKSLGVQLFFIYNHEPEAGASRRLGTSDDFKAAWRKIYTIFQQQGATNAKFVLTLTDYGFARHDKYQAANYYPGDQYVWGIGADAYNWYTCRGAHDLPWRTLEQIITPLRQFGAQHPTKALLLPEFSSTESSGDQKAQWISQAQSLFKQPGWRNFAAVAWWYGVNNAPHCKFDYDSSSSSLRAFSAWNKDAYYSHATM